MKRFLSCILTLTMIFTFLGTGASCTVFADTADTAEIYSEDFSIGYTPDTNWIGSDGSTITIPENTDWSVVIGQRSGGDSKLDSEAAVMVVNDPTSSEKGNVLKVVSAKDTGDDFTLIKHPNSNKKMLHDKTKKLYTRQSIYLDKDTAQYFQTAWNHGTVVHIPGNSNGVNRSDNTVDYLSTSSQTTQPEDGLKVAAQGGTTVTLPVGKWFDVEYVINTTEESVINYELWVDGEYIGALTGIENNGTWNQFNDYFYGMGFRPIGNGSGSPVMYIDNLYAAYVPATDASTMTVTVNSDNTVLTADFTGGTLYQTTADLKDNVAVLDAEGTEITGAVTSAYVKENGTKLEITVTGLSSGAAYTLKLKDGITNSNRISMANKTADFITYKVAAPVSYLYDEDFTEETYTEGTNWITGAGTATVPSGWQLTGYNHQTYSAENSVKVIADPTNSERGNVLEIIPDKAGVSPSIIKYPGTSGKRTHDAGKGLYLKQSMYIDKETASGLLHDNEWHRFLFALPNAGNLASRSTGNVSNIYPSALTEDGLTVSFNARHESATSVPAVSSVNIPLDTWFDIEYYVDIPGIVQTSTADYGSYTVKYYVWINKAYVAEFTVPFTNGQWSEFNNAFYGIAFLPYANGSTVSPVVYLDDVKAAYVDPLTVTDYTVDDNVVTITFSSNIKPVVSSASVFTVKDSDGNELQNAITSVSVNNDKISVTLVDTLSGTYTLVPVADVIKSDSEASQTYTAPIEINLLPDITASDVTYSVSGTTCTVDYTLKNNKTTSVTYTAIAAVYNSNEGLIGVKVLPASELTADGTVTNSVAVTFEDTINSVKFFVWDSLSTIVPLTETIFPQLK